MSQLTMSLVMGMLVLFGLAGTAFADTDASDCANASNEDVKHLCILADNGNDKAQVALAIMYDEGHDLPQSDTKAAKWFKRAAEQGNADAQYIRSEEHT